uniref:pleiotropic regulator 1-like n=1 Tax=Styela clava TaxID=7725 RepID=UPI001939A469|nr:pleiotropic regulator 1-like [Styela clava]
MEEVTKHSVHTLVFRSLKRSHDMFVSDHAAPLPVNEIAAAIRRNTKMRNEYGPVLHMPTAKDIKQASQVQQQDKQNTQQHNQMDNEVKASKLGAQHIPIEDSSSQALVAVNQNTKALATMKKASIMPKPKWHPPWKLYRVISGHLGWVRCVAFEPGNEWFVTGSNDRTIKIWDLASCKLKLSLTGHISTVRGLAVSSRNPYLFSCGEDKLVKCWDLEQNKVVRHYHGHLSACYAIDLHPTIDILVTCGRDSSARVWDMRTKSNIMTLAGHSNTVADVKCQSVEPQVITASHDCTVRLWDLAAGKTRAVLTNHKKSVRSIALHPRQYTFASASPDNIKQWKFPDGNFIQNLSGHNAIVNCLALNSDGVLVSGADNGTLHMWDWRTGHNFQRTKAPVQPGSLDSESGIYAAAFDRSESRLVTCEADKTIKIYKEDDEASEETHPVQWKPEIIRKKRF